MQLFPGPKRTVLSLVVLAVVTLMPVASYLVNSDIGVVGGLSAAHRLVPLSSYEEMHRFLLTKSCNETARNSSSSGLAPTVPVPASYDGAGQLAVSTSGSSSNPTYSQTNDQVPGVDELDTVKTDGQYIYTLTNNTIAMVLAFPSNQARSVAYLSLNGSIQGMFLLGNHLIVVTEQPNYYQYTVPLGAGIPGGMGISTSLGIYPWRPWPPPTTSLWSFDVTDHSKPILTTSLVVNGTLAGARLVGNYVYLIATASVYCNGPIILPSTIVNEKSSRPNISQVYHSDLVEPYHSFTSVVSVDVSKANPDPVVKILILGTSNTIYTAPHDIFLTQQVWNQTETTVVHRIHTDLGTINYEASGSVPGHVLNQFSMDQFNGYFRIATTGYDMSPVVYTGASAVTPGPFFRNSQQTSVYVLDSALHVHGKLEGISPGESFYAARFIGDKAYLVTYQRMDPLFVISLQDPAKPRILGQLNIPGVSDYLQPYDENHLIGFGQSSINLTWENAALFQGLKISLFDVTDPSHPVESSKYLIGDRGSSSPALWDHKSVLFDHSLSLLVIPVEIALQQNMTLLSGGQTIPSSSKGVIPNPGIWQYNAPVWQGAYVFRITSENGIVFRGGVTHLKTGAIPDWTNQDNFVTRSLYIGNVLYTISNNMVKLNSLIDLSQLGLVQLQA